MFSEKPSRSTLMVFNRPDIIPPIGMQADFKNKLSHAVRVRWKRGSRAGISIIAAAAGVAIATNTSPGQLDTMRAGEAVMVTEELNFGAKIPTIPEALNQIERRYVTDDGKGRTFAILDAFGEPTADPQRPV